MRVFALVVLTLTGVAFGSDDLDAAFEDAATYTFGQSVALVILFSELSRSLGESAGFTVGLVLLNPVFALIWFNRAKIKSEIDQRWGVQQ